MQSLTQGVFALAPPGGLFDSAVVRNLFPAASAGARKLLVNRAVGHGEVLRLRSGLYCLAASYRKLPLHPFTVAAALHGPSHVSLESALAFHGLLPEAVFQVASVTARRSRTFTTQLGTFVFRRVPCDDPKAGVRAVRLSPDAWAFVALPLRAIADLVYLRRDISWRRHGLGFLTESLRVELSDLRAMTLEALPEIRRAIRNRRTQDYLDGLRKELRP
jgi:hypothetical protein